MLLEGPQGRRYRAAFHEVQRELPLLILGDRKIGWSRGFFRPYLLHGRGPFFTLLRLDFSLVARQELETWPSRVLD